MPTTLDDKTIVGGQLYPTDIGRLARDGVSMVVCNRPDSEYEGQPSAAAIKEACDKAGVSFRDVPVDRGISPAEVENMRQAIEAQGEGSLFAYCSTGTRSTLLWAAARSKLGDSTDAIREKVEGGGYSLDPILHLLD